MEANAAVSATLGMKNKSCVNLNLYFEIVHVRVRVRVRPYPPFPTTPAGMILSFTWKFHTFLWHP